MADLKFDGTEETNIKKFIKRQEKKRKTVYGDPTRYTYKIIPTGIGYGISIVDEILKEEKDVTDYKMW